MKLNPTNNYVVVKPTQLKMQSDAFFCSQQNNNLEIGEVVATACKEICLNSTVIFFKYSACPFTFEGQNYLLVNGDDIIAYIEGGEKNEQ